MTEVVKATSAPTNSHSNGEQSSLNITVKLRQLRAARVAEFALKQRLERIEWEEKTLKPELERMALEAGESLTIPEYIVTYDNQEN